MAGVLRGSGRQLLGAGINAFSYYVFGLPIGISLALATDLKTLGMWIMTTIGVSNEIIARIESPALNSNAAKLVFIAYIT